MNFSYPSMNLKNKPDVRSRHGRKRPCSNIIFRQKFTAIIKRGKGTEGGKGACNPNSKCNY